MKLKQEEPEDSFDEILDIAPLNLHILLGTTQSTLTKDWLLICHIQVSVFYPQVFLCKLDLNEL